MVRHLLLLLIATICTLSLGAQTSLGGKVTDEETAEPIILGNVAVYKGGALITGTETDLDGNYNISNLDPGTYDVEATYVGYSTQRVTGVIVYAGQSNNLNIKIGKGIILSEVVVTEYKVPLIQQDQTTSGATITSEQIRQLPTRNINALAAVSAGISSSDEGGALNVKGSRSGSTFYYVDGVRVFGTLPPETEIDQLQTVTGGIEAAYGDVTGGFISITTKGPSRKFTGTIEGETSNYLDPYNQSLVGVSLSGPILTNKNTGQSILGYRFSGRWTYQQDDDPPAIPVYRIKDEKLAELEANPIIRTASGGRAVASEYLTNDDVDALDARPFEENTRYDLTGKIDARISNAVDVTLAGNYSISENQFTPGGWRLVNSHNNPTDYRTNYRANFRIRHRLGKAGANVNPDGTPKISTIQNASYSLLFGYEKVLREQYDPRHKDNLFNYGYIGKFDYAWEPTYAFFFNPAIGAVDAVHNDFRQTFTGYTPSDINQVLANYNLSADVSQDDDLAARNGLISSLYTSAYGFHTNVGQVYNTFFKANSEIFTFNLNGGFDLLPGRSEKGRHNIQFGIMHEQRTLRSYNIAPFSLYFFGDQLANRHIIGIDTTQVDYVSTVSIGGGDSIHVNVYKKLIDLKTYEKNRFFREVRKVNNTPLDEYINVNGISPDLMRLDMFSAEELNNEQLLGYYGFDYLGNEFNGSFNDFFTAKDADGIRTFSIAPVKPIYQAAYIQDKFTFKDIIFRLGVRVERFDANTQVLKDPYSLYEIIGAKDYFAQSDVPSERPGNIGDDFKVYTTSSGSKEVKAYRDGDQWYSANGTPVNDGNLIFESGGLVFPYYKNETARTNANYIKEEGFDVSSALKDYEVQINWMPRLAFSFPISEEANFFAHYDILVERPTSNNIVTPLNYYYFLDRANLRNNAALLPQRTISYEVGFQQRLSNTSAIKISSYYRELRDLIQSRVYLYVPVLGSYETYDNQDFGTVKGFTFQYDLRRSGNVSGQVAYTLQFADGTGSDADAQRNLNQRGNLRNLFPLSYDERHRVVTSIDFRYGQGKTYNGPRLFGADIFANAGINFLATAVSGRPYTKKLVPARFGGDGTVGSINGARLPWNLRLDLRVDKSFNIGGENSRGMDLNIYCRVSNILNAKNWIGVYPATGSPSDDGFLQSARGQDALNDLPVAQQEYFINSYTWTMLNPNVYSLPRRIYVGAIFGF